MKQNGTSSFARWSEKSFVVALSFSFYYISAILTQEKVAVVLLVRFLLIFFWGGKVFAELTRYIFMRKKLGMVLIM